jgi:carboxypeptidase family protein
VGLLLVRRSAAAGAELHEQPRTVADLVQLRSAPAELTGAELFTSTGSLPRVPSSAAAAPGVADAPAPVDGASARDDDALPESSPDIPADSVEFGDAPWRRAARMRGAEPGRTWATAPTPIVAPAAPAAAPAPAGSSVKAATDTDATDDSPEESAVEAGSHQLSDPDLTPLMGIPVVRPVEHPDDGPLAPLVAADADEEPEEPPVVDAPAAPAPPSDDEVVTLRAPAPAPVAIPTGSGQPVRLRVVCRAGDPVADCVVTLLDRRGHQVDCTKTTADGGGGLCAPHGGRYLLIASADGFQPRAATLAVDDRPVELALLLPRSAALCGAVCHEGRPVAGARVVAFQEGEVVDEVVTAPDGGYRFDDLAEGPYALSAVDRRGSAVVRVDVPEGGDLSLNLDLDSPDGGP